MAEKGTLSVRGERVDFDLIKIKEQIASAPKTITVTAREDFIDQKFKRRLNRQIKEVTAQVIDEVKNEKPLKIIEPDVDNIIQEGLKVLEPKDKKEK